MVISTLTAATEGGSHGVEGISSTKMLSRASVSLVINTYSGENDSSCGANAWSIQINTDPWVGLHRDIYIDQFTYQNEPNWHTCGLPYGLSQVCVWQVDVTTQAYTYSCNTAVPFQTLVKNYVASVYASESNGILNATFVVGGKSYSQTATDLYGLAKHWRQASGTILGFANGSTAKFTSPTDEDTTVSETSGGTATKYLANSLAYTSEMNNLNLKGASITGCKLGTCTLQAHSKN